MTVAELIVELQKMPQELPVYWDNPDREADEVKSLSGGPYSFAKNKRIAKPPYWQYLGEEMRDVALLSPREVTA